MLDTRILLAGTWIVVMFIYLLGDVLRVFSGDAQRMMAATPFTGAMWLGVAVLMLIPILMIFFSLVLPQPINRWANIIVAAGFLLFNLIGIPGYPSAYDRFLLLVSLVFNGITIGYAWNWA